MNHVEYQIKCPKCSRKAVAIMQRAGIRGTYREPLYKMAALRLICESCGLAKKVKPADGDDFEYWYAGDFRGHRLWAKNLQHLDLLIAGLSGKFHKLDLRFTGYYDPLFATRITMEALPKWMVLAKNRPALLKCLKKMRLR